MFFISRLEKMYIEQARNGAKSYFRELTIKEKWKLFIVTYAYALVLAPLRFSLKILTSVQVIISVALGALGVRILPGIPFFDAEIFEKEQTFAFSFYPAGKITRNEVFNLTLYLIDAISTHQVQKDIDHDEENTSVSLNFQS